MEEDIKRVKEFIHKTAIYYIGMPSSLTNILNELEILQKENEELKTNYAEYLQGYEDGKHGRTTATQIMAEQITYNLLIKKHEKEISHIKENSIPKQVIRDKIDELNKDVIKMKKAKDRNEYITIKEIVWDKTISNLKELLGDE